jgi:hypothetical protein
MSAAAEETRKIVVVYSDRGDGRVEVHAEGCGDIQRLLRRNSHAMVWATMPEGTDALTICRASPIEDWAGDNGETVEQYVAHSGGAIRALHIQKCAHGLVIE